MYKLKRLDTFILGKFLQLFVGAFFICLFVFVMQFMWRYVDDLVGKGLTAAVLGKFFWYVCISLVPTSLPLAVLLASLITFGNMGENLELLSMKAAGVPLVRIMRPIFLLVLPLTFVVYYFQNNIATDAQKSLRSLLVSIKISQPAVEIPEGVFYSMKNFNLYVEKKNAETGMLYHTIIYKVDQGFDRAQIVLADSARIELTADKMHMRLTLWDGEQFQNLKSDNMNVFKSQGAPYDRETFDYKQLIFDFDSNFNELEASQFADIPQAKDMRELNHYVDSVNHLIDSSAVAYFNGISSAPIYGAKPLSRKDSLAAVRAFEKHPVSFDLLLKKWKAEQQNAARQMAVARLQSLSSQYDWQSETVEDQIWYLRRHEVEWHQRITLSLACLLFFFIGAPLGAIIRKGGLGLPTIISVLIFIFYYVINTSGMKMARDGNINMVLGMWVSSMILAPAGAYLTFMANRDAMLFNRDVVVERFRKFFALRVKRHVFRKEVIINPPDWEADFRLAAAVRHDLEAYPGKKRLWLPPNYFALFFRHRPDTRVKRLADNVDTLVEDLNNSTSPQILSALGDMPVLYDGGTRSPFAKRRINWVLGALFPLGLVIWMRVWRFRFRLARDLRQLRKALDRLDVAFAEQMPNYAPPAPHDAEEAPESSCTASVAADQMPDYAPPASHDAEETPESSRTAPVAADQMPDYAPSTPCRAEEAPESSDEQGDNH